MKPTVVAEYKGDLIPCPYCPTCYAVLDREDGDTAYDLRVHLQGFGTERRSHLEKFVTVHYYNYGYYREGGRRLKQLLEATRNGGGT